MVVDQLALDTRTAPIGETVPAAAQKDGRRYGTDIIVDLLQQYGIEYAALSPGASYRGLHDSIVNYGEARATVNVP